VSLPNRLKKNYIDGLWLWQTRHSRERVKFAGAGRLLTALINGFDIGYDELPIQETLPFQVMLPIIMRWYR
jgi:hypothetical protein